MSQPKPEVIFVVENKLGGVAYLNKNLINNATLKSGVRTKVILVDLIESTMPRFTDRFEADEVVDFRYSGYENKYAVLKRLHKLFGNGPGAIVCNDGLEMETIYELGAEKTVYQIIHDFYNLKLAVKYGAITDVYIAHTRLFRDTLLSADPATVQAYFLPHGVTIAPLQQVKQAGANLKAVFTGRLVEAKGVQDLYAIHKLLKQQGITVEWTIIGRGPLQEMVQNQWKGEQGVRFASPDSGEEVMQLVQQHDIFVLPTRFEGSPVTVLEALSTGLVPVVSDLPGGITEIVQENIGRRVPVGNVALFAEAIAALHHNRSLLQELKTNARKLAVEQFDIRTTSNNYYNLFLQYAQLKKAPVTSLPPLKIGFRLDKKWLPNAVVLLLRKKSLKGI